jgi:hypothetical protein
MPRRKSKAGLIAILFIVMAAIGGGVALLVLSQQHGKGKPRERDPIAKGPEVGGGKTDPTSGKVSGDSGGDLVGHTSGDVGDGKTGSGKEGDGKSGSGKEGDGKSGSGKHGGEHGAGGPIVPETRADAGVADSDDGDEADGGGDADAAKVVVLVNSRPQGAEIFGPDGKSLGKTPTNVWVEPGQPLEVTLKLKGRKDLRASIDEHKKKVNLHLERLPRPDHGSPTGGDGGPGATEPTPPKDVCEQDPSSVECRCKKNPDLPECGLE